jgi:hypothetical protein
MEKKSGLGGLAVIIGIGIALFAASKIKGSDDSGIDITIIDEHGNPVPHYSPFSLTAPGNYTMTVRIKNTSADGAGTQIPATFTVSTSVHSSRKTYVSDLFRSLSFAAGETKTMTFAINTTTNDSGDSGTIDVTVSDPNGSQIAAKTEQFSINSQITYGATITIQ